MRYEIKFVRDMFALTYRNSKWQEEDDLNSVYQSISEGMELRAGEEYKTYTHTFEASEYMYIAEIEQELRLTGYKVFINSFQDEGVNMYVSWFKE